MTYIKINNNKQKENKMNPNKYKSVAIDMRTYRLLEQLAVKGFEVEVSMSMVCKHAVKKLAEEKQLISQE